MNAKYQLLYYCLLLPAVAWGQLEPSPTEEPLQGPLTVLQPLLGTWEIDAKWNGGQPMWGREVYRVGLAGRYVIVETFARDGQGPVYQRYLTIISHDDEAQQFTAHIFIYDGVAKNVPMVVRNQDGLLQTSTEWSGKIAGQSMDIRTEIRFLNNDAYRWQVWQRLPEDVEWTELIDGTWRRVTDGP